MMTKRAFGDALEDRGYERKRTGPTRWITGLSLRTGQSQAEVTEATL